MEFPDLVKKRFEKQPEKVEQFNQLLYSFHDHVTAVDQVVERMELLLEGHDDLVQRFHQIVHPFPTQ